MQDAARSHRHHGHRASNEGSRRLRKVLQSQRRSLLECRVRKIMLASQFHVYLPCLGTCLAKSLSSVLNVKSLVGSLNQERALVGAFSVRVKTDGSFAALVIMVTLQLLIRSSFNKTRCGQTSGADTGILSRRLSRYIFRFTFITFNCLLLPWVEMPVCCLDVIQLIINVAEERRNVFLCKCRLLLLLNSLSLPRDHMVLCCLDVKMM